MRRARAILPPAAPLADARYAGSRVSGSGRTARRGRRRTLVAVSLFALTLLAAFFWQRPPTASVLAWRVDWEERWHDPARMRAEWPWLAALRGIEDRTQAG